MATTNIARKFIERIKYLFKRVMVTRFLCFFDLGYIYTYEEPQFYSKELIEKYSKIANDIAVQVGYKSYKQIKGELIENRIRYLTEFKGILRSQEEDGFVEYNMKIIDESISSLQNYAQKCNKTINGKG